MLIPNRKTIVNPSINPNIAPLPGPAPAVSVDSLPNGRFNTNMNMNMGNNNNVSANSKSFNKSKPTVGRAPKKNKGFTKRNTGNKYKDVTPFVVPPMGGGNGNKGYNPPGFDASDFGYEVYGTTQPQTIGGSQDDTLFRDWNIDSKTAIGDSLDKVHANKVTNMAQAIEFGFSKPLPYSATDSEWNVIYNTWMREVTARTNAQKGALDAFTEENVREYLDACIVAYDTLIQLDVLLSWGPTDHAYFDKQIRHVTAQASSQLDVLNARIKLRDTLRSLVLPQQLMAYIRWAREYKLNNPSPESTKLVIHSTLIEQLKLEVLNPTDFTDFNKAIGKMCDAVKATNVVLPALFTNYINTCNFMDIKDMWGPVHNSAAYDENWMNVWDNIPVVLSSSPPGPTEQYLVYPQVDEMAAVAFRGSTHSNIALASAALQQVGHDFGAPFMNLGQPSSLADASGQFCGRSALLLNTTTNSIEPKGLDKWYQCPIQYHQCNWDTALGEIRFSSFAKGLGVVEFYPNKSNIGMAQRQALHDVLQ